MTNIYDVRAAKSVDYEGTVYTEFYATTFHEGEEWCVDNNGELQFPIGNVSSAQDEVVAVGVSLEDLKGYFYG